MATSWLSPTNRIFRVVAMTDGATITPNVGTTDIGTVTIAGNRTMAAPTGTYYDGQQLTLRITQDATGSRQVSFNSIYTFPMGSAPVLSTTPAATDIFAFQYSAASTKFECLGIQIADLAGPQSQITRLNSNSANVNNSTTFVDTGLSFPVIAGQIYVVDGMIPYSSGATPDIKFALVPVTSTLTGKWSMAGMGPGASDPGVTEHSWLSAFGTGNPVALGGDSTLQMNARLQATFTPDVNGTVKLQFTQNTANASNTFIGAGAWLRYQVAGSALPGSLLGLSPFSGNFVGYKERTTDSSGFTTTEVRILSVRAPVRAGRTYRIIGYGEIVSSGGGGAVTVESKIRYTTNDVEPTTSDTQLQRAESRNDSTGGVPRTVFITGKIDISSDGYLRAVVTSVRVEGTVTVIWTAGSGRAMTLEVQDCGPTVTQDGTVY